jgi:hypothetical protein
MHRQRRHWPLGNRFVAMVGCATLLGGLSVAAGAAPGYAAAGQRHTTADQADPTCHLGNGVTHVVELTFDNVHFFRDNPNVPSDLEMMPHLLQFLESNGTLASNNHTPLIAHTANDSLTTYTGLYGDRQGMPISNSYQAYNADGTTDPAGSFAYWTDPVFDTASTPNAGHDTNPSMVFAPAPPATSNPAPAPDTTTPAPWVPFTRAGCDVGDVSTANMVLENTAVDIPKVFGAGSPEDQQRVADPDSFKDPEVADYVGVAVHCAQGSGLCSSATGVKFGQSTPSPTAVTDALPDEPGGYAGFQALFGHRYIAPQLGAGSPSLSHNGFQVTNAAGNLVDLNGNEIDGAFLSGHPGFPGFGPINASQTLAYTADMLESGVPVVYGYIADIHGNEHPKGVTACVGQPAALGSGSACYVAQAQYYDQAFGNFFNRLAADGITAANTLFVVSSDEGDHEVGANVGRAIEPTPAGCDGATVTGLVVTPDVLCTYPAGTFGELAGNINGLLSTEKGNTTPFSLEADSAPEFYVTGNPAADSPQVRALERDVSGLTAANPYSGNSTELITNYLANPAEEAILHMVNADPARTPTFALFAKPDYFLARGAATCAPCVTRNTGFAYDHGDYAAEINTNFLGIAGPGVANLGVDGTAAAAGPNSAGANSGQVTVPDSGTTGTWLDETDIRPTLMFLTGLRDDYQSDGRVVTQLLTQSPGALNAPAVTPLSACYKQLNSSVGEFGTSTLQAATKAIESNTTNDGTYTAVNSALTFLDQARDQVAGQVKAELAGAAFDGTRIHGAQGQLLSCELLIGAAAALAHVA